MSSATFSFNKSHKTLASSSFTAFNKDVSATLSPDTVPVLLRMATELFFNAWAVRASRWQSFLDHSKRAFVYASDETFSGFELDSGYRVGDLVKGSWEATGVSVHLRKNKKN